MHGDYVHIPFNDDDLLHLRLFCEIESIEISLLRIHRGFRRIYIFRLSVADDPSAECDKLAHCIKDREHQSSTEKIERLSVLRHKKARFLDLILTEILTYEVIIKSAPFIRCISEAEFRRRRR